MQTRYTKHMHRPGMAEFLSHILFQQIFVAQQQGRCQCQIISFYPERLQHIQKLIPAPGRPIFNLISITKSRRFPFPRINKKLPPDPSVFQIFPVIKNIWVHRAAHFLYTPGNQNKVSVLQLPAQAVIFEINQHPDMRLLPVTGRIGKCNQRCQPGIGSGFSNRPLLHPENEDRFFCKFPDTKIFSGFKYFHHIHASRPGKNKHQAADETGHPAGCII